MPCEMRERNVEPNTETAIAKRRVHGMSKPW